MMDPSCITDPFTSTPQDDKNNSLHGPPLNNNDEEDTKMSEQVQHIMSLEERQKGLYDLHGVSGIAEETEELIALKLEQFDKELRNVPNASALKLAMKQSPDFVKKQQLMFLRADQFDAKEASRRMVRFFEIKRNAFGKTKLTKDITWGDLAAEDKKAFEIGAIQLMPHRDTTGRAVFFHVGPYCLQVSPESKFRFMCFLVMMIAEDVEVQRHGMVFVTYNVEQAQYKRQSVNLFTNLLTSSPIRLVGFHVCYSNPILHPAAKFISFMMNKDVCRFRAHFGSHMECQYSLMTFGIARDFIPVNETGELKFDHRDHWRPKFEEEEQCAVKQDVDSTSIILVPGPFDVLLGRGRHSEVHIGNLRFKHVLAEYQHAFEAADRYGKPIVSHTVFKEMKKSGSRFIEKAGQSWIEVSDDDAKYRISHTFRNFRVSIAKKSNADAHEKRKRELQS